MLLWCGLVVALLAGYFYGIAVARRVCRRRVEQAYQRGRDDAIAYVLG